MSVLKETLSIKGLSKKVSLALFAMVSISVASHASAKTVNDIIKTYYPIYNETKQCRGIIAKDGSSSWEGQYNKSGYCIEVDRLLQVDTSQGKRLYMLVSGEVAFHEDGSEDSGSHADTGLVGMLVLKPRSDSNADLELTADGWQVEYANPAMNAGSFGKGLVDWELIQVAPDYWGFINIHSDSHYSQSFSEYVLLTPDPSSKQIIDHHIMAESSSDNNYYAPSGCSKDSRIEYCNLIKVTYDIDKATIKNGFYPLKLTINGHEYNQGATYKTVYNSETHKIFYVPTKGYVLPEDYPLK